MIITNAKQIAQLIRQAKRVVLRTVAPVSTSALYKLIMRGIRQSRSPFGVAWKAKVIADGKRPLRGGGGRRRGGRKPLLRSITQTSTSRGGNINVDSVLASIHQFGATIKPKKPGGYLTFKAGGKYIRLRQSVIPARPFLPLSRPGLVILPAEWRLFLVRQNAKSLRANFKRLGF